MKLTIGLPFLNAGSTLADTLRSIFAQTYQNWELLLGGRRLHGRLAGLSPRRARSSRAADRRWAAQGFAAPAQRDRGAGRRRLPRGENLLLYHGILAPHARWRSQGVSYGRPSLESNARQFDASPRAAGTPGAWTWAALLRRVFDFDGLTCPRCGSRLRVIASVQDPRAVQAILLARSGAPAPPGLEAKIYTDGNG